MLPVEWIMITGLACVAWTMREGIGLLRAARLGTSPGFDRVVPPPAQPTAAARPRRRKRYAAWDESGRPIDVEDATAR